jgi:uncharacterized protein YegJ (DUF2314 family)
MKEKERVEKMLEKIKLIEKEHVTLRVDDEDKVVKEHMWTSTGKVTYKKLCVSPIVDALLPTWGNPRG